MPDQPLQPFAPPTGLPFAFPSTINPGVLITWLFYLTLLYWLVYTAVAIYHWLAYSHSSATALPAISIHIFVSFVLIGFIISGII